MNGLPAFLLSRGRTQRDLARAVNISDAAISQLINHHRWPVKQGALCAGRIRDQLTQWGADEPTLAALFASQPQPSDHPTPQPDKEDTVYLRHQRLHPETCKRLRLFRDPFNNDINAADDLFLTPDAHYVREEMIQAAKNGGFLAVVGESGSGKSTLRLDLLDRIQRERQSMIVIEPSCLGSEETSAAGRVVRADALTEAILTALDPAVRPKRGLEARTRQIRELLIRSTDAGFKHLLLIEEAHGLSKTTLKHLKRFNELRQGFARLLGIVLIGQPELMTKLNERSAEVREVVQRIDIVELPPLGDALEAYVAHKIKRVGCEAANLIEPGAYAAMREILTDAKSGVSRVFPLAINNLVVASLNLAAGIGANKVTADVVRQALREAR